MPSRQLAFVLGVALALALAACSSGSAGRAPASTSAPAGSSTTGPAATGATGTPTTAPGAKTLRVTTAPWALPEARAREVVLGYHGALLVIGGLDPSGSSTGRVWHVDLGSGVTTRLAVLPQSLHDSAGAVIGADAFVFGGGAGSELATVQRYRAGNATVVGQLPRPRSDLVATASAGTAYVLGGFDGTTGQADVLATNDGISFRTVTQLPVSVRYPALADSGGALWLFGGTHDGATQAAVQRIETAPGSVSAVVDAQLPAAISDASAVDLAGHLLILGGRNGGDRVLDSILEYDPARRTTRVAGTLPYAVADAGVAVVDGVAYLVGGENDGGKLASAVELRYG